MSLYVISIGGTGHRVTEALLHLAEAGCVPTDKIKLLCVDSDIDNGNLDSLIKQINLYKAVSKNGSVLHPVVETAVMRDDDAFTPCWSPTIPKQTLEGAMNKNPMKKESGQIVFNALYTEDEQTVPLDRGFYGHTSIGALLMAKQIRPDGIKLCEKWDNFFNGINHAQDKILLIGSTFGGTGAAGIPTISTILRQTFDDAKIGTLLIMPYFKFVKTTVDGNEINVDWTYFAPKSKTALSYYEKQQFHKIFNDVYIIGEESTQYMDVPYALGSKTQKNKPHIIELFAATAILDFLRSPSDGYRVRALARESRNIQGTEKFLATSNMLVGSDGDPCVPQKLSNFLRFSVMYTKYYYHCLTRKKADGSWIKNYQNIDSTDLKKLFTLCGKFISWMKDTHLLTDMDGKTTTNLDTNVQIFNFQNSDLFNGMPEIKTGIFGGENVLLVGMNDVADVVVGKTFSDADTIDRNFSAQNHNIAGSEFATFISKLLEACIA